MPPLIDNRAGAGAGAGAAVIGGSFSLWDNMKSLMTPMRVVIVLIVIACIGFTVYYYHNRINAHAKTIYNPNNEFVTATANKEAELILFAVDWCPHSKSAKPAWEDIKAQYENKLINGYKVTFTEINCTEESAEVEQMMNKYSVEGFPTIKLLKDGQVIEYDAKPTKETLSQFLETVL